MGTLEGKYEAKLKEFAANRAALPARRAALAALAERDPEAAKREIEDIRRVQAGEDEIEYMLAAAPFIREHDTVTTIDDTEPSAKNAAFRKFAKVTHATNKNSTLQRYMVEVERDSTALVPSMFHDKGHLGGEMVCSAPKEDGTPCNASMVLNHRESARVCPECGSSTTFMELTDANMSYEQEVSQDVVTYFAYKRLNHFTEWITSLQAKENTEIPEEVMDAIRAELKKARATKRSDITTKRVREYLKKLKVRRLSFFRAHLFCIHSLSGGAAQSLLRAHAPHREQPQRRASAQAIGKARANLQINVCAHPAGFR